MDMYNTHNCDFRIKIDNLSEEKAFEYERKLISYYKEYYPEYRLTNQTDGGEGASGWCPSEEIREKHRRNSIERWENEEFRNKMIKIRNESNSVYQSEEFRNKISNLVQGENNPNYGHYWTNEMKEKASQQKKGKYKGENNPNYGNHWSEEQRNHLSEIRKNGDWRGANHGMAKRVVCLETGEVFECIEYAKNKYGANTSLLSNKRFSIKSYHLKEISEDYIVDMDELTNELIDFYKQYNNKYTIFFCQTDNTFYFGYDELRDVIGFSRDKINKLLKKYGKIEINNKIYIKIQK